MKRVITILFLAAAMVLAGCDSDGNGPRVQVQVLHASADAPAVNILVDGEPVLTEVNFKQGDAFPSLPPGTYDIVVEAITPGGEVNVIELLQTSLDARTEYTVLAIGSAADLLAGGANPLQPLVLANPRAAVAPGAARIQVVHASPDAPEVSVYLTALGADLAASAPVGTFSFGEDLGPVDVPAGNYQVRVTLPPAPPAAPVVVFDSGEIALAAGDDLVVAAVNNTTTGTAPVSLVVLARNQGSLEILDIATPTQIRAVHASPDAPAVDVVVNDDFVGPLFSGLTFSQATGYAEAPAGQYNVKIVDSATQGVIAWEFDGNLIQGVAYTAIATGFLANLQQDSVVLTDDSRRIATEAKLRLVHSSPSAGAVDIYLVEPGTDISSVAPAFTGVVLGQSTGYVGVTPGDYTITLTPAGDSSIVAFSVDVSVTGGSVYTAVARDNPDGPDPVALIPLDDLAP